MKKGITMPILANCIYMILLEQKKKRASRLSSKTVR